MVDHTTKFEHVFGNFKTLLLVKLPMNLIKGGTHRVYGTKIYIRYTFP